MQKRPSDTLWREFGAWIKELRESKRLSQAGAAHRAGIDRQTWYRIENGKSGTRRDTVIEIAKAVSADIGEALKRAGFSANVETEFSFDIGGGVELRFEGSEDWNDAARTRAVEAVRTVIAGIRARESEVLSEKPVA